MDDKLRYLRLLEEQEFLEAKIETLDREIEEVEQEMADISHRLEELDAC